MSVAGRFFTGKSTASVAATLSLDSHGKLLVEPLMSEGCDPPDVRVTLRVGSIPREVVFPDGSIFETGDNDGIDALFGGHAGLAYRLESSAPIAVASTLLLVVALIGAVFSGIPWFGKVLVDYVPDGAMTYIGEATLHSMDEFLLEPSELSEQRQAELTDMFEKLVPDSSQYDYQLAFRMSDFIGANAFALPNGTILFTDDLIELSDNDDEIAAIMLHEIGHVELKHSLRRIITHAGIAVISGVFLGDLTTAGSMALGMPNIWLDATYARDMESEADSYALGEMQRRGMQTDHFANILTRLSGESGMDSEDETAYWSTHPPTQRRIARFQTAVSVNGKLARDRLILLEDQKRAERLRPDLMQEMLKERDYQGLHSALEDIRFAVEQGQAEESLLETTYELSFGDAAFTRAVDDWVEAVPDDYTAHLARSANYYNVAWERRGGAFNSKTTDEQRSGMHAALNLAEHSTKIAQELRSTSFGWSQLISIAGTRGESEREDELYEAALQEFPHSYTIRKVMLSFSQPKWGGSPCKLRAILRDAQEHAESNPELAGLAGYMAYIEAGEAFRDDRYEEAIRLATRSLQIVDKSWVYNLRADAYDKIGETEFSLLDSMNAVRTSGYDPHDFVHTYALYQKLGHASKMEPYVERAIQLEPHNEGHRKTMAALQHFKDEVYANVDKVYATTTASRESVDAAGHLILDAAMLFERYPARAEEKLAMAAALSPDDYRVLYYLARITWASKKQAEPANQLMEKSLAINPGQTEAYYWYGRINHDLNRPEKYKPAFNRYIELAPQNEKSIDLKNQWSHLL